MSFGWVASSGGAVDNHEVSLSTADSVTPVATLETVQRYSGATGSSGNGRFTITPTVRDAELNEPVTVNGTVPPGMQINNVAGDGWTCEVVGDNGYSCVSDAGTFPEDTTLPPIHVDVEIVSTTTDDDIASQTQSRSLSPDAQASLVQAVEFGPSVDSISPNIGPVAGGETVTIAGSDLADATVTIGGEACTDVVVNEVFTSLTCTVPEGAAGPADVVVTVDTVDVVVPNGYKYLGEPVITSVSPNEGSPAGGETITIAGEFLDGASVTVGGEACTDVNVAASGDSLTCVTPLAPAVGPADVEVTTVGGTTNSVDAYTYLDIPVVSGLSPTAGPTEGGNVLTIEGVNLVGSTVTVGGQECSVIGELATSVTCLVPPGDAGNVPVVVTKGDTSVEVPGGYTYMPAPAPTSVSPTEVPTVGGTEITIEGSELFDVAVTIGGQDCSSVVVAEDGNSLTCTAPPGTRGEAPVVVTGPGGSASTPEPITYLDVPLVTEISPTSGPIGGAFPLTIEGRT